MRSGLFLLFAGVTLACAGIWRGEVSRVLMKAILICLECIGLG